MYIGDIMGKLNNDYEKITTNIKFDKNKIKSFIHKDGKIATTYIYKIKETTIDNTNITTAIFIIITGRTHQIRLHMKYIGKPIICDTKYGLHTEQYIKISKKYKNLALKSLVYIFHFKNKNIGYLYL